MFLKSAGSYENAKETERDVLTCDENGFAQTKDMPYGIYTVRQTFGWEGRELMKDFDVFISKDGQTYRYLINNANFESYIKIVKKDAETGNTIPYAGAGFQIYDPNGNLVTMTFTYPEVTTIDTFYTTADGDLITPQTLEYGKGYSLVEVQAPYGYVLNSEPVYFDVVQENSEEESGITVIEVVRSNMAQKGTITVEKSGEVFSSVAGDKGLYQPIFSVRGLEGAVYEITAAEDIVTLDGTVRAKKGEVVDTVTTGKDGTVKSKELYLGKYEVKEITAPYGMVLNEEVRSVELVYAGQNVDVTETATSFYNERQRVEIDLIKSLAIDEAYGIGKNGEIFDVTFGLYAAEELTAADGKTIPADGLIEVISLDESGHGKAISDLPMGSYYVQEISTNSAYIVSDAKYPVTFEYAGQDTETVRITANEGEAITNDIIYGSVSGKKSDEDGKALGGAVIGIFKTGTTEFTKENAIAATTSKDDGSFSFAKVPYGTWIIREIESPKGYVLSEEEIAVTIGKVDEVVEIELVNYFIKGNIALTKVDEDYPDNKLSGAVFEVYSDTNGDGKLDKDDTLLGEMKELDGGVYQMSELRYGKYLVKETKAPTGFVLDEDVYAVSIEENGKTYTVENKAGVGFINAAQKGSLKIVKTSSDGKVEGFSFRVTGVDYDQTFKTDKNGEIVIEGLWIGDYTVSEVSDKASAGYILPADKQATVKVNATAIVQMHNEFRDTPKTGDDFNLGLWVSLAALSVVGAGVLGFVGYKNRNAAWAEEFKELYASLSPEEYRAAMESTLTAFYTPPVVIKAMYDVLDRLGFSQGNILEPSCGTGNFFGLLPESMQNSKLHGVEIDSLTGRIAKQLYQKANIAIEGFEKTNLPDDHFDVVLGNVPFGEIRVNDSRYNAQKFLIHDYFFAKALDKVRAGGVVMFITSKGTMDKASPEVRKYIAQRAELLGAIRLPDNTFKANAGTEVTSDILILQKRDRVMDIEPDWVHLDTDENGVTMNRYFVEHPEMVLGEIKMENTRFGTFEPVCKARKDIPLSELLSNAVQRINGEIPELDNRVDEISDEQELSVPADPNVRNFSFTLVDGRVYFRENDRMQPASVSMTAENRIKGLIQIRDCVRKLIEYQTDDYPEEMIRTEQENLNRLYDVYTAKYGLINSRGNYLAFASDESYFLLCSLEVLDDEGNFKRKADMFTKRTIKPHREVTSVETASEALALSIGEKARVDLPYMEQLTGKTQAELVQDLQGVIFKVPNCEHVSYVAADEYLSGNVRNKLTVADLAAKNDPELAVNVEALEKVIPKDLSAAEISVRLGATWIPQEDIQRFVMELLTPSSYAAGRLKVRYTPINGDWFIENKSSDMGNVKADSTYGTKRASAYRIIEDTLNLRDTRIFDYVYDEHGNKKAVFNAKETTAAQAKQEVIKQAFQDWIWKDPERRNRLVRYYNDTFNSVRPREYDGSHITFGGISPEITLRPHQVNAIAHILYGGNTLLAHKVGAGKTFEMVAAAQESKRLGLCQKSMFVVPNHLVGQWASEYLRLYPSANILVTTKRDFETGNRKKFCGRIATGDYDAVIIGHSQFEKIPMSIGR